MFVYYVKGLGVFPSRVFESLKSVESYTNDFTVVCKKGSVLGKRIEDGSRHLNTTNIQWDSVLISGRWRRRLTTEYWDLELVT